MILVTGATGQLGSHLLYQVLQTNDSVVALYRNEKKKKLTYEIISYYSDLPEDFFARIIWRQADLTDIGALEAAFDGITEVYHCAGYVGFVNKKYDSYYNSNVVGTRNIVNISLALGIKKLVHVSSIAALGLNANGLTTEKDTINIEDVSLFYAKTKYYGEMEVWRGIEEGLNAVIVYPSVILAPYFFSKKIEKIIKYLFSKGVKYYVCGKKGYVDVRDVAKIMEQLMKSDISAENFIINSENKSFKTIIRNFTDVIGKPKPHVKLTYSKLKFLQVLFKILTFGNSTFNNKLIYYALSNELYSSEKLQKAVSVEFIPVQKSIENMITIFKKRF